MRLIMQPVSPAPSHPEAMAIIRLLARPAITARLHLEEMYLFDPAYTIRFDARSSAYQKLILCTS